MWMTFIFDRWRMALRAYENQRDIRKWVECHCTHFSLEGHVALTELEVQYRSPDIVSRWYIMDQSIAWLGA